MFFGPLELILRTLQLPFTDNRIKSYRFGLPARVPSLSSQFYQYSPFRTSPFASPSLQANSLPTTFVGAHLAIFALLSVPFLSSGLHFPYNPAFKYQFGSHPPCQAFLPTPAKIILWIINFIHSLRQILGVNHVLGAVLGAREVQRISSQHLSFWLPVALMFSERCTAREGKI